MKTIVQQLAHSNDKKSTYKSALFWAEAARLIGEVKVLIQGSDLEEMIKFSRPNRVGRASDTRITGIQLRTAYEAMYMPRVLTLTELILSELEITGVSTLPITSSEFSDDVKSSIQGQIEQLAKYAAEL